MNLTLKNVVTFSIVLCFIFSNVLVTLGPASDAYAFEEYYVEDAPVSLVGFQDSASIEKGLKKYSSDVRFEESVLMDDSTCLIVDGSFLKDNSSDKDLLTQAAHSGRPVAIVGDNFDSLIAVGKDLGMAVSHNDAQAYGIHYDEVTDTQYVYNVSGFNTESEVVEEIYALMNTSTRDSDNEVLEGVSGAVVYRFTYNCGNFGKINGSTEYFAIEDTSDNYNFYMAHYKLQGIPNSGYSKSLLGVLTDVDADSTYGQYQTLLDYNPTTSSGTTTVSFGAGVSVGYDGGATVTAGFNASWSYALSDTSSIDNSDFETNYFNVNYDINECKNAGYNTLLVEPGAVFSVSTGGDGSYHAVDTYKAQFCKVVIKNLWHNTFTNFTYDVNVEVTQ